MPQISSFALPARARAGRALAGALALGLSCPPSAAAFFQQTKLEGVIGADIGGVWLAVHQVMPEFRITYQVPADGEGAKVPFKVGPIPESLADATGPDPVGVLVTECTDAAQCRDHGIFVGDVVVRVNTQAVATPEAFETALESVTKSVLLSIRRASLRYTSARLIKMKYESVPTESEGTSSIGTESLSVTVLDSRLPFYDAVEKTRLDHQPWRPTPEELVDLGKRWAELPSADPINFITGNHRVVAAANFDDALAADVSLQKSKVAVVMNLEGNPIRGSGGKLIDIYGIEEIDGKRLEGNYVSALIASAPFPITVEFKGRFRMDRIADWSDADDVFRAKQQAEKAPAEDLDKYELAPDVPPAGK